MLSIRIYWGGCGFPSFTNNKVKIWTNLADKLGTGDKSRTAFLIFTKHLRVALLRYNQRFHVDGSNQENGVSRRSLGSFVLLLMLLLALCPIVAQQGSLPPELLDQTKVPPLSSYAGEAACARCHAKLAKAYASTPHALDSSLATAKTIVGDFSADHARLHTRNPNLDFVMIAAPPDGFYQSAVDLSDPQNPKSEMKRIDIVVGAGRHGQTYLYWQDDKLFELPVSYWTYAHRWVNSPGYPDGELHWDRSVGPRCLECHASYFVWQPMPVNRYAKDHLLLGIDCERCHGPGALHVKREHSAKPPRGASSEQAIVNPARLSRDQQMSLCALCHAGGGHPIKTPMSFVVGDDVNDYLKITPPPPDAPADVHGNQVGALEQSKCFRSGKLTCSTCHDVHQTQENADAFSSRCLTCHQVKACGEYRSMGNAIRGKCIECHMPVGKSNAIATANAGQTMQATMRAHRIAIYPGVKLDRAATHLTATDR